MRRCILFGSMIFDFQEFFYWAFNKFMIKGPIYWNLIELKTNFGDNH